MRLVCAAAGAVFVVIAPSSAIAQQPTPAPTQPLPGATTQTPGQKPPPPAPGQPEPGQPAPAAAPTPPPPQPRTFTAPVGLLFNTVRADRVEDFEMAMGYLQAALASSTNERVREQAAGWRIYKATEAAPGGAVLYVFLLDPTVVGADYSLGRVLADAYPDQAKLQEIWKLYSGSVTGGSLLNLSPFKAPPLTPATPATPASGKPSPTPIEKP
jgi:hypothetical protein